MKDYNHEIKCLADLENRYANIQCHGGYGNNPEVLMISRESLIYKGFIKKVNVTNGVKTLYIDSEYGHEIALPYEKIIGMTILSNKEQAQLEYYLRNKEHLASEIVKLNDELENDKSLNNEAVNMYNIIINAYKTHLKRGEELIAKGVKTFK